MKRKLNSCFILALYFNFFSAQVDAGFINHLTLNNLGTEHRQYLAGLPANSDSSNYYKAKFNLKYFNDSLFLQHYLKSKLLCDADTVMLTKASVALLMQSNKLKCDTWFNVLQQPVKGVELSEFQKIYRSSENPNLYNKGEIPAQLQPSYLKYKKAYNKNAWLGAGLSTVVPGLGKLYAGKTKSFFTTLLLNSAYAAQTIESTKKLGITHPLSIINAGAFAVFYLSNIYGSYKTIQDLKKEYKKQYLTDATQFYN